MYHFKHEPKHIIGESENYKERGLTFWRATLRGTGVPINDIARKRSEDGNCTQLPRESVAGQHLAKVSYALSDDGYITIQLVIVSFYEGHHWTVFYDPQHDRVGTRPRYVASRYFYYLNAEQLDELLAPIYQHHDKAIYQRLARDPSLLPEESEPADPWPPDPKIKMKF